MNEFIDIYCERLGPGFWAEPVNAITNLSFLLAAIAAFDLARRQNALDWQSLSLIALTGIIGIGSFLFHTFATVWAQLADVLPILAYQIVFISVYAQRVMNLKCRWRFPLLGLFLLLIYAFGQSPGDWLNGSLGYAPALIFVTALGIYHARKGCRERYGLLAAAAVFVVSLSFRTFDAAICPHWGLGLHFLWHLLNGLVLYLSTRAYILNAQAEKM